MSYPRTSENDPITVDFLSTDLVPYKGEIGMTYAPGKTHQGMHLLWDRNLQKDLDRLRDIYHTDVLVSLIELHEFRKVKIPTLFAEAHARNIETVWFPIPDMSVPTSMDGLIRLVHRILHEASLGKKVVIHCMGGFGRTGVVTACCVVTFGYTPEQAIAIVRNTREYTVETQQQEEYVSKFAYAWNAQIETCA